MSSRQLWKVQSHVRPSVRMQETFGIDPSLIKTTACSINPYSLRKYMVLKADEFLSGGDIIELRKQLILASAVCM